MAENSKNTAINQLSTDILEVVNYSLYPVKQDVDEIKKELQNNPNNANKIPDYVHKVNFGNVVYYTIRSISSKNAIKLHGFSTIKSRNGFAFQTNSSKFTIKTSSVEFEVEHNGESYNISSGDLNKTINANRRFHTLYFYSKDGVNYIVIDNNIKKGIEPQFFDGNVEITPSDSEIKILNIGTWCSRLCKHEMSKSIYFYDKKGGKYIPVCSSENLTIEYSKTEETNLAPHKSYVFTNRAIKIGENAEIKNRQTTYYVRSKSPHSTFHFYPKGGDAYNICKQMNIIDNELLGGKLYLNTNSEGEVINVHRCNATCIKVEPTDSLEDVLRKMTEETVHPPKNINTLKKGFVYSEENGLEYVGTIERGVGRMHGQYTIYDIFEEKDGSFFPRKYYSIVRKKMKTRRFFGKREFIRTSRKLRRLKWCKRSDYYKRLHSNAYYVRRLHKNFKRSSVIQIVNIRHKSMNMHLI
jgi:hypothetical protein